MKSGYTYDPDHDFFNDITTSNEANCTGYTGGFNGASRLTTTVTLSQQTASNRIVSIIADKTWTALGGATNNTLIASVLGREITDDTASIPIAYLEFSATVVTNGSDILVDQDGTNGNIRWTV